MASSSGLCSCRDLKRKGHPRWMIRGNLQGPNGLLEFPGSLATNGFSDNFKVRTTQSPSRRKEVPREFPHSLSFVPLHAWAGNRADFEVYSNGGHGDSLGMRNAISSLSY